VSRREILRLRDIREAIATIRDHIAAGSFEARGYEHQDNGEDRQRGDGHADGKKSPIA
jgi:hypothetical protein